MLFYLTVAAVALLAGGIASIAGMGIGSLLTPLLAFKYGMKTAVAAVSIPHLAATVVRFLALRKDVDWATFRTFGLMNAAGSLAGAWLHTRVESTALTCILAALLIFAGAMGVTGNADRMRFGHKTALLAGVASGAFGGLVGNQGGIRSAAMLGLGLEGPPFVATATAIALAVDAARMPFYFTAEWKDVAGAADTINIALLGALTGTLAGERVLRRIPRPLFKRVVAGILLAIGILLLVSSAARDRRGEAATVPVGLR